MKQLVGLNMIKDLHVITFKSDVLYRIKLQVKLLCGFTHWIENTFDS